MDPRSETPLRREDLRRGAGASPAPEPGTPGQSESRKESLRAAKEVRQQEATARLKRRLNWTILGLTLAIVVVYLILFFVG